MGVGHTLESALFQWEGGEMRLRAADRTERVRRERASELVLDELRRRLGSSFTLDELAELYASGSDWALTLARAGSSGDASAIVDAAFMRYAREASDYRYRV